MLKPEHKLDRKIGRLSQKDHGDFSGNVEEIMVQSQMGPRYTHHKRRDYETI